MNISCTPKSVKLSEGGDHVHRLVSSETPAIGTFVVRAAHAVNCENKSTPDEDNRKEIYQGTIVITMTSIQLPSTSRHICSVITPANKTKGNRKLLEFADICGSNYLPDEWKGFQFLSCDNRYTPGSNSVEDSAAGDSVSPRTEAEPVFKHVQRVSTNDYRRLSMPPFHCTFRTL